MSQQKIVELGQYTVIFSPKNKGYGVSCKKGDEWISPYEAQVVFAPTTASTKFELRVKKPHELDFLKTLDFKPIGHFRVVSWNVQFGNLLDDKERAARILKALQPDVLLLQELDGDDTPQTLTRFLVETFDGSWDVCCTPVSGTERHHKLRSAVATNRTLKSTQHVDSESWKQIKAIISTIDINKTPINFVSLHLRCCGGPTGEAEEQWQDEAWAIREAIESRQSPSFVVAGDWNLVGTTKPLQIVQTNEFAIVDAYQPDGRINATWSDVTSSFTPSRLDWMLYSPKTLALVNSFVLDTADLDSETLHAHGLMSEDTAELSDHLPLVADFERITK